MKWSDCAVCDVLTHCAHLYMLYLWVFCSHIERASLVHHKSAPCDVIPQFCWAALSVLLSSAENQEKMPSISGSADKAAERFCTWLICNPAAARDPPPARITLLGGSTASSGFSAAARTLARQPKLVLNSEKFTNCHKAKNAKIFQLLVVQLLRSQFTRTNATAFPLTLNYRIASRLENRLDCRARRFLRMLVLIVAVIVDHEELV